MRQRDRETERQRGTDRYRETEKDRDRDTDCEGGYLYLNARTSFIGQGGARVGEMRPVCDQGEPFGSTAGAGALQRARSGVVTMWGLGHDKGS